MGLFPGLNRVEEKKGLVGVVFLVNQTDQVSNDLAIFLVVDASDGLIARIGDLFCIFGKLDLRDEFSGSLVLDRSQFVNTAEGWAVFGGDQVGADTPGVDGCALKL